MTHSHPLRRIAALTCAAALTISFIPKALAAEYMQSGSLDMNKLSESEITKSLEDAPLSFSGEIFVETPSTSAPYKTGVVNKSLLQAATNRLNALRRIAGLSPVRLDLELSENAQYGAVLLAASEFSHRPNKPSDMDNSFHKKGYDATASSNLHRERTLTSAVDSFMDDSDHTNIDRLGHRRWQLNPKMGKVGFGFADKFTTEKVFDTSAPDCNFDFVSWPASGKFLASSEETALFKPSYAWSVSLNPKKYSTPNKNKVSVTLTRKNDGHTWVFDSDSTKDNPKSQKYFNIDTQNFGIDNCIIFRPDDIQSYDGLYTVQIDGLQTKSGKAVDDFTYEVDFFSSKKEQINQTNDPKQPDNKQPTATKNFIDVPDTAWYAPFVKQVVKSGTMTGTGNNRFQPNHALTLAEVVTLTARYHAKFYHITTPQSTDGAWWQSAYDYCVQNDLLHKTELPASVMENNATRLQMIMLLEKAIPASYKKTSRTLPDGSIPDVKRTDSHGNLIYTWYERNLIRGNETGHFCGNTEITRAETAVILTNIEKLATPDRVSVNPHFIG